MRHTRLERHGAGSRPESGQGKGTMSGPRRYLRPLALALAGGPLIIVLGAGAGSAAAASAPSGRVAVGSVPTVPAQSKLLGALAPTTRLSLAVALAPHNAAALTSYAKAVSTPGNADYRHYLSVSAFRSRFGASTSTLTAVRSALSADGLKLGATSANGLSFEVSASASALERAFSTTLDRVQLAGGRVAYTNTTAATLPAKIGRDVQAVLGLSNVFLPHRLGISGTVSGAASSLGGMLTGAASTAPSLGSSVTSVASSAPAPATTSAPTDSALASCSGASTEASSATSSEPAPLNTAPLTSAAYTAQQIAQAYDYDPLYSSGDLGQGVTVGVFELEPNFPTDITAFESCYGIGASVNYVEEDGGAGTASASNDDGIETELDIENIIELAPKSSVDVYQAPNSDDGLYDNYSAMVTNPAIKVISSSWGECESEEGATAASAENTLFEEGAAEGISMAAAAGDSGAEDCELNLPVRASLPTAAVDDPASQPFVTGVGGTSLTALGDAPATRPTETVWNNGVALALGQSGGAGGGGVSSLWDMPTYQSGAASALNVVNSSSSGSTCSASAGDCRAVPDVSADADPYSAYVIYWDGSWTTVGGTSGAAPLWASLFAEADSNSACQSAGAIGFANPALYTVAGSSTADYAGDFNDITSGNNDLYDTNLGEFAAGSGYDMATGLGTPVAGNLVPALCGTGSSSSSSSSGSGSAAAAASSSGASASGSSATPVSSTAAGSAGGASGSTSAASGSGSVASGSGSGTTSSSGATPATGSACKVASELTLVEHPSGSRRVTRVVISVNGKVLRTMRGKRILKVTIKRPAATKFTVKYVSTLSNGEVISQQLSYNGCKLPVSVSRVLVKPSSAGTASRVKTKA